MVEYLEDSHTYLIDGIIVPSVSKLIDFALGATYANVNPFILQRSAEYGTNVHDAIQRWEEKQEVVDAYADELMRYMFLKKAYGFEVDNMEQIVSFENHYAGRYDILGKDGCVYDIKTTSTIHKDRLEWQLGLYQLALGIESNKGYVIWLPKGKKEKVKEICPKDKEECLELIKRYEEQEN